MIDLNKKKQISWVNDDIVIEEKKYDTNNIFSRFYNKQTRLPVLLSFTMCFIDSIINNYKTIVIFEDDMVIDIDLPTLNASTEQFSNSDLEFFYMGYCFMNCNQKTKDVGYLKELSIPSILCGHAMCIKSKALPKLIEYCFPMKKPSDELFMDYYIKNKSRVCIPHKPYFNQFERTSDNSLNESTVTLKYCQ